MKKALISFFFTCFCCIFLIFLLFYSKECIALASNGLLIWYRNMIPSLFPFMVLSGFIIRCGLSAKIGQWLQPFLGLFFRLPPPMLYVIFMGFLCGFPMGAKMVADMLEKEQITEKEGEYLLSFCNNIGPLYMLGYVIPLFDYENTLKILGLMYLIPFMYGLILRYAGDSHDKKCLTPLSLSACFYPQNNRIPVNYLVCFQQSLSSAIEQITILGGCMVFFNCLLIFPQILNTFLLQTHVTSYSSLFSAVFSSLIEIGGGLHQLALSSHPTNMNTEVQSLTSIVITASHNSLHIFLPLALLTFGGLSCIAQTCFILKNTGLKISTYIKHKFIQACIFIILIFIF